MANKKGPRRGSPRGTGGAAAGKPPPAAAAPGDVLRVAITFHRPSDRMGLTAYGARMSADVVGSFVPAETAVSRAVEALTREGFEVTSRGRLSVSVRGRRADFERAFGTRVSPVRLASVSGGRYSSPSVFYPGKGAPWAPKGDLKSLVDNACIQWPHIYMARFDPPPAASPLPPRVAYHHLRVPGDVALLLGAARAHRAGITGKGVTVAMIDSGFAHGHAYFREMGYRSSVVLAPGASDRDADGNGHGTGESANLLAVAPDATFVGVKLDNEQDPNLGASVLEGFHEAMQHGPKVVSVSLGYDLCPSDPVTGRRTSNLHLTSLPNGLKALEAEIQAAVASGVVVVFSAGNGHVSFPGMMPEVISAGGAFVEATGAMRASDYASAFMSRIYAGRAVPDFCGLVGLQPHADYVMLPIPTNCEIDRDNASHDATTQRDGWGVFSGTSAAAPQIAGVCALLLQKDPTLSPSDVKQVLRRTARDVTTGSANPASNENAGGMPAGPGPDGATGSGLVDVFAALAQV